MSSRKKPETKKSEAKFMPPAAKPPIAETTLNWLFILALLLLPVILYRDYLGGAKMLFGSDFIGSGGYASRKVMADYLAQHGAIAGWLPFLYSGLPTYAAFFGDIFYPVTILLRMIMPVHIAWTWTFVLHIFLAGLGTYLFLKELKIPGVAAFLLALAYMFSGSVISNTHEGHDGRLICTTLLPLVLFFLEKGMNSRRFLFFILSGTVMGMQLLSGHLQQVYYTGLISVIYFVFRAIADFRDHRQAGPTLKLAGYFAAMLVFMGCLVAIQYLPIYGNVSSGVRGTSRGYQFATSWALPPEETFDIVTPRFSGGMDHYWGRNPFKRHTEYFGILPLILALFGIFFTWKDRMTKFLAGLLAFTILMAWGGATPFYYIPYYLFPGVAKFRAPALIFFTSAFTIVALAGIGLRHLLGELRDYKKVPRFLLWIGGVSVGLLIIFAIGQGAIAGMLAGLAKTDVSRVTENYRNFLGGMLIATVLTMVNLVLIWLLARRKLKSLHYAVIAGVVLVADLWISGSAFVKPYPPPSESFAADEVINQLKPDNTLYRAFPLYYQDPQTGMGKSDQGLLMLHGIQSIGGQHPNPLQHYMNYLGIDQTVMFSFPPNLLYRNFMNLLNTKYVISVPLPDEKDIGRMNQQQQQMVRMLRSYVSLPGLTQIYYSQNAAIYRNDSCLPRAFLAADYEVAKDKNAVVARLKEATFNPRNMVLLADDPGVAHNPGLAGDSALGLATVKSFDNDKIVVEVNAARPCFLVLSENYHPDWQATDNGKPMKILRAFETLRAVPLTAGAHTIEFKYASRFYRTGSLLSLLAAIFLALTIVVSLIRRPAKRIEAPAAAS